MNPPTTPPAVVQSDTHPDEAGHVADAVRDACLQIIGKVVTFDDSRKIAEFILSRQTAINEEFRTLSALGDGEKEERQPVDFEAEGKKVNDLYWRETPAYIAMMGVVRGYVLGQASLADPDPLAAKASEEA